MSVSCGSIVRVPAVRSGASRMANIFSAAAMPLMAVWKNDPSVRSGMKNSAERKTMVKAPAKPTEPAANCMSTTMMPTAAPPKANKSMMVMELSCILSRFMVARRKLSASSFMMRWRCSSAW